MSDRLLELQTAVCGGDDGNDGDDLDGVLDVFRRIQGGSMSEKNIIVSRTIEGRCDDDDQLIIDGSR